MREVKPYTEAELRAAALILVDIAGLLTLPFWQMLAAADKEDIGVIFKPALDYAVRTQMLVKCQGPDCWYFKAGFPGVDIDAVHRKQKQAGIDQPGKPWVKSWGNG